MATFDEVGKRTVARIQMRRDTAANFQSQNPRLYPGEIAFETDTGQEKIGNGPSGTPYNDLPYRLTGPKGDNGADGAPGAPGAPGLPGTNGVATDDAVAQNAQTSGTKTNKAVQRRRAYDVRDYMGAGDIGAATNAAIAAAYADSLGFGRPGQVLLPPGSFAQTTEINWFVNDAGTTVTAHGIDLIGSDRGTRLIPQGSIASLHHISSSGTEALRDLTIANFEIDGSSQTNPAGGYVTAVKGTYMQRLRRVRFIDLWVHDVIATGIGNDFHDSCMYDRIVAENCGRGNDGTKGGGAGIGIGTGVWINESLVIANSTTRGNKNDGLFFETQSGLFPVGTRVIAHTSEKNGRHGIADAGLRGLSLIGGTTRKNTGAGFAAYQGTIAPGAPGQQGVIVGLHSSENTVAGVLFDSSVRNLPTTQMGYEQDGTVVTFPTQENGYVYRDAFVRDNVGPGILARSGANVWDGLTVSDVDVVNNGGSGVALTGTAGFRNVTVQSSRLRNNGTTSSLPTQQRAGLYTAAPVAGLRLVNVRSYDTHASGSKVQQVGWASAGTVSDLFAGSNDLRGNVIAADLQSAFTGDIQTGFNAGLPVIVAPLVADSFVRADSTGLGSSDGGTRAPSAWTVLDAGTNGQWSIVSNVAKVSAGTGNTVAVQNVGRTGGTHQVTLAAVTTGVSGGLAFRVQDASNLFYIAPKQTGQSNLQYAIQKRVGGTNAVVAGTTVAAAPGDTIRVVDDGTTIKLYVNGVLIVTGSDTAFNTATNAGLHGNYAVDGNTRYSNWSYTPTP